MRVRQQMMGQQDRLGRLHVRLTRHDGRRVGGGLGGQRRDDVERPGGDPSHRIAQPHPEQRGHLIVS